MGRLQAMALLMSLLLAAGSAAALAAPAAAAPLGTSIATDGVIYRDIGLDPKDSHRCYHTDIRSSTRTMFRKSGHRFLRVTVDGWFCLASMGSLRIKARLDTREGPRAEYVLAYYVFEGSVTCTIKHTGPHRAQKAHVSRPNSDGLGCRVRAHNLRISKPVRWRFVAEGACGGNSRVCGDITDRAPNQGWYP